MYYLQACSKFPKYSPKITFSCVQKRHQTRLFAGKTPDGQYDPVSWDRNTRNPGNVAPGIVVDTEICHPKEFDYYLNSHAGVEVNAGITRAYVHAALAHPISCKACMHIKVYLLIRGCASTTTLFIIRGVHPPPP
jgi:hypothetical protein